MDSHIYAQGAGNGGGGTASSRANNSGEDADARRRRIQRERGNMFRGNQQTRANRANRLPRRSR